MSKWFINWTYEFLFLTTNKSMRLGECLISSYELGANSFLVHIKIITLHYLFIIFLHECKLKLCTFCDKHFSTKKGKICLCHSYSDSLWFEWTKWFFLSLLTNFKKPRILFHNEIFLIPYILLRFIVMLTCY